MKVLRSDGWKRRGISVLWDAEALVSVASPDEVLTLRQFVALSRAWPEDLPGNGTALVVAGLKGALEVLSLDDARQWLETDLRPRLLEFQDSYQGGAALIFWFPSSIAPFTMTPSTASYYWTTPTRATLAIGHSLWGGAEADLERIIISDERSPDSDGPAWGGLFHPRIS